MITTYILLLLLSCRFPISLIRMEFDERNILEMDQYRGCLLIQFEPFISKKKRKLEI